MTSPNPPLNLYGRKGRKTEKEKEKLEGMDDSKREKNIIQTNKTDVRTCKLTENATTHTRQAQKPDRIPALRRGGGIPESHPYPVDS